VIIDASPPGYAALLGWALEHASGPRLVWAVDGCGSDVAGA
jgi:hypothetical protein